MTDPDPVPAGSIAPPWDDPAERGPGHPNWLATCDWGDCDEPSVTMRWDDRLRERLPVCAGHAPPRDPPDVQWGVRCTQAGCTFGTQRFGEETARALASRDPGVGAGHPVELVRREVTRWEPAT